MSAASEQTPAAGAILKRGVDDDMKRQAAALYRSGEWSERKLGNEFGVPRSAIRKWLDELGVERRTKAESALRRRDWAARRQSLLVGAGACGSPTCNDPKCDVRPGGCHRADCSENATVAAETCSSRRHVRGHPTKYCTGSCSAIDNQPHEQFKLDLDRLRDEGHYDIATVAAELDRAPQTVLYHVHLLGLGKWGAGYGQVLLSKEDREILRDRIVENPRRPTWVDPRRRAVWQHRRHRDTSKFGALGGPKRKYDQEQFELVRKAKAAYPTWGPTTIADVVNKALPTKRYPMTSKKVRGILSKPLS